MLPLVIAYQLFFSNFPVLTPSSKQIKLALIFSSKSVNPGSHLTNPICKVKERVGEVWAADIDIHRDNARRVMLAGGRGGKGTSRGLHRIRPLRMPVEPPAVLPLVESVVDLHRRPSHILADQDGA